MTASTRIEVVLPAHNEAESIGHTILEFYEVVHNQQGFPISFLVCEDGSTDNTCEVVQALAAELPVRLLSSPDRKGYSRAVVDGFGACSADLVAFIDSDGQNDPADFAALYGALEEHDVVVGYRNPRQDATVRLLMSSAFGLVYRALFPVRLKDPSCPFLLLRRQALQTILQGRVGILKQGFWWEFNARAVATGLSVGQVPVHHRSRLAGSTRVYRPGKLPRLVAEHLHGLFVLRGELAKAGK